MRSGLLGVDRRQFCVLGADDVPQARRRWLEQMSDDEVVVLGALEHALVELSGSVKTRVS